MEFTDAEMVEIMNLANEILRFLNQKKSPAWIAYTAILIAQKKMDEQIKADLEAEKSQTESN